MTILQRASHVLADQDPDVSQELEHIFAEEGIEIHASAELIKVKGTSGTEIELQVRTPEGERIIQCSDILVATGRFPIRPTSGWSGLECRSRRRARCG